MSIDELFRDGRTDAPLEPNPRTVMPSPRTEDRRRLHAVTSGCFIRAQPASHHPHGHWAVYFVLAPRCGRLKIGTTRFLLKRISSLAAGAAEQLTCLGWVPGGVAVERAIHGRLADSRRYGEWFDLTPEVVAELARFGIADPLFE